MSVAATVHKSSSTSPSPAITTSGQNLSTLNPANDSSPQITPTHKILEHSTIPIERLEISGQLDTGKYGVPSTVPPPTAHEKLHNTYSNQFPVLTSNFTQPNRKNHSPLDNETVGPSHVRLNACEPHHSPVIPSIQQLNHKFNHKAQNPAQQFNPVTKYTLHPTVTVNANVTTPPLPPSVIPTYATRLRASQTLDEPIVDLVPPLITTKQGLPAVLFNREDFMIKLASKCRFTLIGKFLSTMPKLEVIRSSLTSQLQITGECKVTHFNSTHVYIDLDNEFDHAIVWNKERIYIDGRLMRLLVWTPTFRPEEETTISPVWVVLSQLPWHCYTMPFVSKLLEPVGRVLFFDAASIKRTRGSVAKVKIEIDITKPRPPHVWLGFPQDEGDIYGEGRWQELQFENVPEYCQYCKHQGHSEFQCKVKSKDEEYKMKKKDQEEKKKDMQNPGNNQTSVTQHNKIYANASNLQPQHPIYEKVQSSKGHTNQQQDQHQASIWQVKKKLDVQQPVRPKDKFDLDRKSVELKCKNGFDALAESDDVNHATTEVQNAVIVCGVPEKEGNAYPAGNVTISAHPVTSNSADKMQVETKVVSGKASAKVEVTTVPSGNISDAVTNLQADTGSLSTDIAMKERVSPSDENNVLATVNVPVILENAQLVHEDNAVPQAFTNTTRLKTGSFCTSVDVTKIRHNNFTETVATSEKEIQSEAVTDWLQKNDELTCNSPINILHIVHLQKPGNVLATGSVTNSAESTKAWVERSFEKSLLTTNALHNEGPTMHSTFPKATDAVTNTTTTVGVITGKDATATKEQITGNAPVIALSPVDSGVLTAASVDEYGRKAIPETSPLIPTSQLEVICNEAPSRIGDPGKLFTNATKEPELHRKPWNSSQSGSIGQKVQNYKTITLEQLELMSVHDIQRMHEQDRASPPKDRATESAPIQPKRV